jgi:hypothetical protein
MIMDRGQCRQRGGAASAARVTQPRTQTGCRCAINFPLFPSKTYRSYSYSRTLCEAGVVGRLRSLLSEYRY